jgi:ABC-type spermidine/putrescine transport system permease subunit I
MYNLSFVKDRWLSLQMNADVVLLLPALVFLCGCFLYPLFYVLLQSFDGTTALSEYQLIFRTPIFLKVIVLTFRTAGLTTLLCVVLGYIYAGAMCNCAKPLFVVLLITLLVPFWVSLLLRTFSWVILLQDTGLINRALISMHAIREPLPIIRNMSGVVIGMVHVLLPYAVLPIYAVMRKVDPRLMEAARGCGAGGLRVFYSVVLPLSMPGVLAAAIMSFTLSLSFYITPSLLGGPSNTMIGQLIATAVTDELNFPFASALSVVLLAVTGLTFTGLGITLKAKNRKLGAAR